MIEALRPHSGPQTEVLKCSADIAVYGGAVGGGKSMALLMEACRHIARPTYSAVIFRRTYPSIRGPGSIFEQSRDIYSRPGIEGVPVESPYLLWTFPTGAMIQFSHLQHAKDALSHRGREYAFIGWDEVTEFEEAQFWELFSRNRTTCGIRPYIRATCNPDPDHFIRVMIDWWLDDEGYPISERSGVIRHFVRKDGEIFWTDEPTDNTVSFTFIPASLDDNPTLTTKDPEYRNKLEALPLVERTRLLGGNWNIRPSAGMYFRRSYFEVIEVPPADADETVRAWDRAATKPSAENPDPDWTVGVKYSRLKDASFCIEHVERLRESPLGVEKAVQNTATSDGKKVRIGQWQDPGAAGKADAQHFVRLLNGYTVKTERAAKDKVTYAGPVSSQAEAGNIKVVRGLWNEAFFRIVEGFPDGAHDDDVDALSLAHMLCSNTNLERLRRLATM